MTPLWGPPPPGLANNSYFQAVNADIGATVEFQIADGNTYADKAIARLAAGDLPDIIVIPSWEIDKMADFNTAVGQGLRGPHPLPAGRQGQAVPAAGQPADRRVAVVGVERQADGGPVTPPSRSLRACSTARTCSTRTAGTANPKTADELYQLGKTITDPKAKRWAFGDIHEMAWPIFGVPQEWRYDGRQARPQVRDAGVRGRCWRSCASSSRRS